MPRATVTFESNVPVELALAYRAGKQIDTARGPRVMFTLSFPASHVMFHDLGVAEKINRLDMEKGERFWICKRPKNGSTPARWDVWLSPETEQERADREIPSAREEAHERKAPQSAPVSQPGPVPPTAPLWAGVLVSKTDALIDAYAACLEHAQRHGNRIKPDDIRSLLTTVYIAMTKAAGVSHAA